ncbi:MAG: glycosyltransferase family 1 protein [Acidimicrobiales bacterium]
MAVDAGLGSFRYGGLGGYIVRLVRGLAAMPGYEVTALVPTHCMDHNELGVLPEGSRVVPVDVGRDASDFYDRRAYWEQEVLPATLASGDYDAYFGPTLVLPLEWPGPKIVAVHDLAFEVAPDFNTPLSTAFYSRWARASAEAADGVIAISQATANDLKQRWGISGTVSVTPLASCLDFVPADREQSARLVNEAFGVEAPFALNVGGNFPRKNLRRLLKAAGKADVFRAQHKLVIVVPYQPEAVIGQVRDLGLDASVEIVGYCPPDLLPHLYTAAQFFVYPSLFEGFGLPPLEALQCGTPVAVSDREPFHEVLGEGKAVYFDPTDIDDIAAALDRLSTDYDLRTALAESGPARAALYSWANTIAGTARVISRVAAGWAPPAARVAPCDRRGLA